MTEGTAAVLGHEDVGVPDPRARMSPDQRRTLVARAMFDARFRERLLRDPRTAARTVGIELSDWEHDELLRQAAGIRDNGVKIDGVLDRPGMKAVINGFIFV